jgi:hypothetical protein
LDQESVGLLGEGRPGQVRLIDPQGQHADDGRVEIECDGRGVPWRATFNWYFTTSDTSTKLRHLYPEH